MPHGAWRGRGFRRRRAHHGLHIELPRPGGPRKGTRSGILGHSNWQRQVSSGPPLGSAEHHPLGARAFKPILARARSSSDGDLPKDAPSSDEAGACNNLNIYEANAQLRPKIVRRRAVFGQSSAEVCPKTRRLRTKHPSSDKPAVRRRAVFGQGGVIFGRNIAEMQARARNTWRARASEDAASPDETSSSP